MRQKELITTHLERTENALTGLDSIISAGRPMHEVKDQIALVKEMVSQIQTFINNESDSWN